MSRRRWFNNDWVRIGLWRRHCMELRYGLEGKWTIYCWWHKMRFSSHIFKVMVLDRFVGHLVS